MPLSIFNKFLVKEEKKRSFFLALEITPSVIKAACCEIEEEKIGILGTASQEYDGLWENAITAGDKVISKVEENLPSKINLEKVILGLPEEFIKEGKIAEEQLPKIKELCQKLLLTPLGFVEIPLAIANYLKKQEGGTPESLVLLRLGPKLEVALVRVGKISNNTTILFSGNLAMDLEMALKSFTDVEVLPSKILIFDGGNLETAKQELMNHPWTARVPFLHFPKIEAASMDLDIKSIAYAGGSEMMNNLEIKIEEVVSSEPEIKEPLVEEGENFGFVKDAEILEKPQQVLVTEEVKSSFPKIKFNLPKFNFSSFSLPGFNFSSLSFPKIPKIPKAGIIILIALTVLILMAGLVGASWFLPTAQVNLFLQTKNQEQQLEVTLDPKLKWEIDENLTQKATVTGKKLVGDKAKGVVTIYNKTQSSKIFKAGTIIVSSSKLKFTLDSDVTLASASASDPTVPPVFGKADVNVSASDIGPEGNLGVGQIFTVSDLTTDQYAAKNSVAFSGGTSREISVISRIDQDNLLTSAQAQLAEKAKKDLLGKLQSGENLFEQTLTGTITQKKFDKEVAQEGTEVNLDLTMHFSVLGYRQEDLFTGPIPQGYEISKDSLKVEIIDLQKNKDNTYKLKANLKVSFLPKINMVEIKKNLAGKNLAQVDIYLRSLGNLSGYEVKFQRTFFLSKNILPHSSKNIVIESSPLK